MASKQFKHWLAIPTMNLTSQDRAALCVLSNQTSKGEACPPFISRNLRVAGVVITHNHVQTIN